MGLASHLNNWIFARTGYRLSRIPPAPESHSDLKRILETDLRFESWGAWSDVTLGKYTTLARDIEGDFAEIGVACGRTFHRLAKIAGEQGRIAHAIDSFVGMAKPGKHDRQEGESGVHYEGEFSVGGAEKFAQLMDEQSVPRDDYRTWEGFVPEVFKQIPDETVFALAILDVDHYQPTVDALQWLWPRINEGGYLLLDDSGFYWDRESTRAIKEFLAAECAYWIMDYYNNHLILRKEADEAMDRAA